MRVAGVSLALTRTVLARGSSSCPSCNGRWLERDAHDELLMRQVRRAAEPGKSRQRSRGFEAGQKARNRLVGPVSGCLMPGEGRPAIGARFASARWRAAPGVMREDGGFGAECGDPLVPQHGMP
jgi:hypothetical protein